MENMANEKILITPAEAQELLGVGRNKIYDLLREEDFPAFKLGTKFYINKEQLQTWADNMCKYCK